MTLLTFNQIVNAMVYFDVIQNHMSRCSLLLLECKLHYFPMVYYRALQ